MAEAAGFCSFAFFDMIFICQIAVYWWIYCMQLSDFGLPFAMNLLGKFAVAAANFVFALGGAIAGAMEGRHTAETGFIRGAGISVISVAIVALHELFDPIINGNFRSKILATAAITFSFLVAGHASDDGSSSVFPNKQWHRDLSDSIIVLVIFGAVVVIAVVVILRYFYKLRWVDGVQTRIFESLPTQLYSSGTTTIIDCAICLEDFEDGETIQILPCCSRPYHYNCMREYFYSRRSVMCPCCRRPPPN